MNFDIKTEQLSDDAYVISLAGEVDLYTAPEFKQQLLEVIGQGGKEVVVDFTNTTFIDSTTLGVLVGGVKRLRSNDGQLSLVCSDRNITKIFEITGLDRVFTIHPTRDEAVSKLGNDGQQAPGLSAPREVGAARSSVAAARPRRLRHGRQGGPVVARDQGNGQKLFQSKCAGCHVLAAAGSQGTAGPNLDDAFVRSRSRASRRARSGMSCSTRSA